MSSSELGVWMYFFSQLITIGDFARQAQSTSKGVLLVRSILATFWIRRRDSRFGAPFTAQ